MLPLVITMSLVSSVLATKVDGTYLVDLKTEQLHQIDDKPIRGFKSYFKQNTPYLSLFCQNKESKLVRRDIRLLDYIRDERRLNVKTIKEQGRTKVSNLIWCNALELGHVDTLLSHCEVDEEDPRMQVKVSISEEAPSENYMGYFTHTLCMGKTHLSWGDNLSDCNSLTILADIDKDKLLPLQGKLPVFASRGNICSFYVVKNGGDEEEDWEDVTQRVIEFNLKDIFSGKAEDPRNKECPNPFSGTNLLGLFDWVIENA